MASLLEDNVLAKRQISESARIELAPRLASRISSDETPDFELADLAATELSLKIRF